MYYQKKIHRQYHFFKNSIILNQSKIVVLNIFLGELSSAQIKKKYKTISNIQRI